MKKKIVAYNFAYKCLYFDEGLILVFNDIKPFKENEIQLEVIKGELFVHFGNNIALLSSKAIEHLKKTKKLYLTKCGFEDYEDDSYQYAFEVDPMLLSKLEGVMLALKEMFSKEQEAQKNQEIKQEEIKEEIKQDFLVN
jgi:hypothetical protein